jgi:T5SS/PEP-CTERM-associated repeat protein
MSVLNGASITGTAVTLANTAGSSGVAEVSGAGSTWSLSSLTVGNADVGSFTVDGGAVVTGSAAFTFAASAGSDATGVVSGSGSSLGTTGDTLFGDAGTAMFTLSDGATLSNDAATVGNLSGSSGTVLVSGPGTTWTNSGAATVGVSGFADVTVDNGAHVSSSVLDLAQSATGSGQLTLTDSGTLWTVATDVTVGGNGATAGGTGTLSIQSGASLTQASAAGVFRIHAGGTVNLDGGTLTVGSLANNGGTFSFSSGTLNITAAGTALSVSPTGALGATLLLDANQALDVTNTVDVAATGLVEITGDGTLTAGTLNNAGEIRLTSELAVLGGTTLSNGGLLQGTGQVNSSLTNNAAGEVRVSDVAERLAFNGGSNANDGTINATGGGTIEFTNGLTNNAGASINVAAGSAVVFGGGLTGTGTLSGAGTKYFAGGTSNPPALVTTGDTVVEAPAIVTTAHVRENNLTVYGGLSITPAGTDAGTSTVETVTVANGGTFNLTNNDLVVKGSTLSAVQALLASGFAGGLWNGPGINSSAASQDSLTALGSASNGLLNRTEFSGVTGLDADDVLVKYTYYGDADLSGATTLDDFTMFLVGYQNAGTTWAHGDFNYSGSVTLDDFTLLLLGYQQQGAPLGAVESLIHGMPMSDAERTAILAAVQAVPEPAAFGVILLMAGCGTLGRQRRR